MGRTGNASREFADNRGVDKAADDAQLAGIVDNKFTQGIPVGQPDIVPKADAAGTGRVDDPTPEAQQGRRHLIPARRTARTN